MYSREVEGAARTFGVSGKLWHGVLVMFDRESGTLWTQLDGRAIHGAAAGQRLEHVPSVFTVWGMWREAHPDTLVLKKSAADRAQRQSRYAGYFADSGRLFRPELAEDLRDELEPKATVFGLRLGTHALAVTERHLEAHPVVNARVGDEPVALLRNSVTGEVRAVSRRVAGQEVELEALDGYESTEFVAVGGSVLDVSDLAPLRVDRAFWYAWARTVLRPEDTVVVHDE